MNYENSPILDWHLNDRITKNYAVDVYATLGLIPSFVFEADPRPAWEQFEERYIGGWNPMLPGNWTLDQNDYLHYPGDPAMPPLAYAMLRHERILVYPYAFICIVQPDGSFSVARMD